MGQVLEKLISKFNQATSKIEKVSTELLSLDYVTDGGIPKGEVTEIYGENGVGKTTLSLIVSKAFLDKVPDKAVVYIDSEYSLDPDWCMKHGLDLENFMSQKKFYVLNPDSLDEALTMALDAIKTNEVSLVVIDSIAALAPAEMFDIDDPVGYNKPGLTAKKQTNFFGVVGKLLRDTKTALFVVNQMRANISPYGASTTVPGSYAFKHKTALRLEVKRSDFLGGRQEPYGIVASIKAVKNKHGFPYRTGNIAITFKHGLDILESNIDFMTTFGIISRAGAYYYVGDEKLMGRVKLKEYLLNNQEAYKELIEQTLIKLEGLRKGEKQEVSEDENTSKDK